MDIELGGRRPQLPQNRIHTIIDEMTDHMDDTQEKILKELRASDVPLETAYSRAYNRNEKLLHKVCLDLKLAMKDYDLIPRNTHGSRSFLVP